MTFRHIHYCLSETRCHFITDKTLLDYWQRGSQQASKSICRRECHVLCVADVVLIVSVCVCGIPAPMLSVDEQQESFAC